MNPLVLRKQLIANLVCSSPADTFSFFFFFFFILFFLLLFLFIIAVMSFTSFLSAFQMQQLKTIVFFSLVPVKDCKIFFFFFAFEQAKALPGFASFIFFFFLSFSFLFEFLHDFYLLVETGEKVEGS